MQLLMLEATRCIAVVLGCLRRIGLTCMSNIDMRVGRVIVSLIGASASKCKMIA